VRHGMNMKLQHPTAHSPSFVSVSRSLGPGSGDLADFCIPCNPYFPTDEMFTLLADNLRSILKFYPSDAATITEKLASTLRLNPATIAMSNGSTELITWIDHLLIKSSVAVPVPTFGRWTDQPLETGKRVDMYLLREGNNFDLGLDEYIAFIRAKGSRVAVLCNPNNPDGGYLPKREVIRFMDELADLDLVIIDESFIDFVELERNPSVSLEASIRPNVVVLKSLGKNFGLHGIRFGYQVANPALTRKIAGALPKWNLNSIAETIVFMLADHRTEYEESLKLLAGQLPAGQTAGRGRRRRVARLPALRTSPAHPRLWQQDRDDQPVPAVRRTPGRGGQPARRGPARLRALDQRRTRHDHAGDGADHARTGPRRPHLRLSPQMPEEPFRHDVVHRLGRGQLRRGLDAGRLGQWVGQARNRHQPDVLGVGVPLA